MQTSRWVMCRSDTLFLFCSFCHFWCAGLSSLQFSCVFTQACRYQVVGVFSTEGKENLAPVAWLSLQFTCNPVACTPLFFPHGSSVMFLCSHVPLPG